MTEDPIKNLFEQFLALEKYLDDCIAQGKPWSWETIEAMTPDWMTVYPTFIPAISI